MNRLVCIKDLDKADVLLALWRHSKMQGMSFLAFAKELTRADAEKAVIEHTYIGMDGTKQIYFDYFNGKVMKVDIANDEFDAYLYDRDNGPGAAQYAIDRLYQEYFRQRMIEGMGVSRELLERAKIIPKSPTGKDRHIDVRIIYRAIDSDATGEQVTHYVIPGEESNASRLLQEAIAQFYNSNSSCDIVSIEILD